MTRLALVVLLAGCSSMSAVQDRPPETFTASSDDAAACIATAWQAHNKSVSAIPIEGGQRITVGNPMTTAVFATVDVIGRRVDYRKGAGATGWTRDDVIACL